MWSLRETAEGVLAGSSRLDAVVGITHGASTRKMRDGDAALLRATGLAAAHPARPVQVHGNAVWVDPDPRTPAEADAVIVFRDRRPDVCGAVVTADCVPILIAAADGAAVAAVHAGWRGTAARIVCRTVEILGEHGYAPRSLVAALGPAIGECCYPVGEDVEQAVRAASPGLDAGTPGRIDLVGANRRQLEAAGVPTTDSAPWCTACHPALFPSYRRDATAGRIRSVIGFVPPIA